MSPEPIAVIGLGCVFPGATGPDQFWQDLLAGRDRTSTAGPAQIGVDPALFYDAAPGVRDCYYSLRGGFVNEFQFDPQGYRLPPQALDGLDPLFTWSLDVARQALNDAGYSADQDVLSRCGVVLGNLSFPTRSSHRLVAGQYAEAIEAGFARLDGSRIKLPQLPADTEPALANLLISGYPAAVVADALGLGSARLALDAACASSLYAVHLACEYLRTGKADLMLAGAVSCADPLFIHMGFSIFHAYPANGVSRPLDRASQGLVSGEGAGMVALKRYRDAVRDGDRIYATIRGVGLSNDGAGKHVLTPNPKGQALAFDRAYAAAGVSPDSVAYLECHATGTPVGDVTELNSIEDFFGAHGHAPLIGSVKSNFGHLLTAAGIAGMIKTILSMAHGRIPRTINVSTPLASRENVIGRDQIVSTETPWPAQPVRRAGVSAFGFGGTNAHLVLDAGGEPAPLDEPGAAVRLPRMAIVGMDGHFGQCDGLDALDRAIYRGEDVKAPLPPERWHGLELDRDDRTEARGGFVEEFELDFLRSKIPPDPADPTSPQHLLMLRVADRAIRDSGLPTGGNVAVVIAMGTELELHEFRGRVDLGWQLPEALANAGIGFGGDELSQVTELVKGAVHRPAHINQYISFIGNIMASRVASLWDFTGPAFTISAEENSTGRALEVAQLLLAAGDIDAVVVGAVDLAGGPEHVLLGDRIAPVDPAGVSCGHDENATGWTTGEGAGAVVLRRVDDVAEQRTYAVIESLAFAGAPAAAPERLLHAPSPDDVTAAARAALDLASVDAADIGYIELAAAGVASQDAAELAGLASVYDGSAGLTHAAGSAKANFGHTFAAAGMLGLIRATLSLAGRYLPATPGWTGPADAATWEKTAFYVPDSARPWFDQGSRPRLAAVNTVGLDGCASHVVLSEGTIGTAATAFGRYAPSRLLVLTGNDAADLATALDHAEAQLQQGADLAELARSSHARSQDGYALSIVAVDAGRALAEIRRAREGARRAFETGEPWETPAGSYFTPSPLGPTGGVAFVYPGAFNSYVGMGRDLACLFPTLHESMRERGTDLGGALCEELVYPRSRTRVTELADRDAMLRLGADPAAMMQSGTALSVLLAEVLTTRFGVRPGYAFGYSMGEGTMLWASGVWGDGAGMSRRLRESSLFTRRLAGRCEAAREYLGIPGDGGFWASYVVTAPAALLRHRLSTESRLFVTHVNTPSEVVVAGHVADAERVLAELGVEAVRAPVSTVIHCDAMRSEHADLVALHRLPAEHVPGIRFYSAAGYAPTSLDSDTLARNIADATCAPVDFPRLVDGAYADGARIFVEVGPRATCSRWIATILADREHVVVPTNRRGESSATSLVKAAARLVAHRVPLTLDVLDGEPPAAEPTSARSLRKTVTIGGTRIAEAIAENAELQRYLATAQRSDVDGGALMERSEDPRVVWDEDDLLEFAGGSIAKVFGPEYAEIDAYPRRVRLPVPPYLLVSRVTRLAAERGSFEPSTITTEYDIPEGAWYTVDGQAPWAVSVESGQCDLLLISYLGIDFESRGERVYRLLDCTLTFLADLPKEGDTLRYDISINSFARSGDTLLFFFSYECFVGDTMVLRMDGGCAGFFTDEELAHGRGVVDSPEERRIRQEAARRTFTPPLTAPIRPYGKEDLLRLTAGELPPVFGSDFDQDGRNPSLRLPPTDILMVDRVVTVDPTGGDWGLGLIVAEQDLSPDSWFFPCHFSDDQVMAGSLMADGCGQLLQFYMLFLGLQTHTFDARFQPLPGVPQAVRCRGQVTPQVGTLTYRMEVTDLGLDPVPFARANVDIILDGVVVVRFRDLALQMSEKNRRLKPPAPVPAAEARPVLYDEQQVREFATGSLTKCFGPDLAVYDERRAPRIPNGDLQLVSRVLSVDGERLALRPGSTLVSEYDVPANPWFCWKNAYPAAPYSVLMEIGLQPCGFLSAALGSPLTDPDQDFYFRNLDGSGHLLREVDVRGKTITNRATLLASNSLPGMIIQQFEYRLECDGEAFFTGDASFGYFTGQALAGQTGLDAGRTSRLWSDDHAAHLPWMDLHRDGQDLYHAPPGRPHERLARGQLDFLDTALVVPEGGTYGQGYVAAAKAVVPDAWFFDCHFYADPVMPGSLGVEAVLEAMQIYALRMNLCADFTSPRMTPAAGNRTVWKYRGQITQDVPTMRLEAHVKQIERVDGGLLLLADASLWRENLRIYDIRDVGLMISEAAS